MMRLVLTLVLAFVIAAIATLVLAICVPEAHARQRDAWQLGVCLDTHQGTRCGLHGQPWFDEGLCETAKVDLQGKIVVGRARCAKVTVDDVSST